MNVTVSKIYSDTSPYIKSLMDGICSNNVGDLLIPKLIFLVTIIRNIGKIL